MGSKKIVAFRRITDFIFDVDYSSIDLDSKSSSVDFENWRDVKAVPIARVNVTGLNAAMKTFGGSSITDPRVKISVELDVSGLLIIKDAFAYFEVKQPAAIEKESKDSLKDSVYNFFGGNGKSGEADSKKGEKPDDIDEADWLADSPIVDEPVVNKKEKARR